MDLSFSYTCRIEKKELLHHILFLSKKNWSKIEFLNEESFVFVFVNKGYIMCLKLYPDRFTIVFIA